MYFNPCLQWSEIKVSLLNNLRNLNIYGFSRHLHFFLPTLFVCGMSQFAKKTKQIERSEIPYILMSGKGLEI